QSIDRRALNLALFRRHFAEARQQRRNRPFLAERAHPHGFEGGFIGGAVDGGERLRFEFEKIGHGPGAKGRHLARGLFSRDQRLVELRVPDEKARLRRRAFRETHGLFVKPPWADGPWPFQRWPQKPPAREWRVQKAPCDRLRRRP